MNTKPKYLRRVNPHANTGKQRSQQTNSSIKLAREILGGKHPSVLLTTPSPPVRPSGPSGVPTAGASAHKQTPAQARQRAIRQPASKSRTSSNSHSTGQESEASALHSDGDSNITIKKRLFPPASSSAGGAR